MKKFLKKIFVLMTICISIPSNNFIFAESDEESYLKEDKAITESLGSNMIYAPHTGNVNLDYLYQMIQHHKGAIDMAKNLLNNGGENEEVVQIAKDIIKNQTISIASMESLMKTLIENLTQDKVREEKYLKEYQNINEKFSGIISESLAGKNLQMHAKASRFVEDYKQWIDFLEDSYEVVIYKEALAEYQSMLLFWCMGLYKHAFISLRSYFEATMFGIQLSTNEFNFRLWKSETLDLYWSQIMDDNEGIFSKKFVQAFEPLFADEAYGMKEIAKKVYRECSEFIHNNYGATSLLPKATQFDQVIFELLADKVESINQVIVFAFTMRYVENIIEKDKLSEFEEVIMDEIGYLGCAQEIYN